MGKKLVNFVKVYSTNTKTVIYTELHEKHEFSLSLRVT